jgi:hypothetical protein
MMSGDISNSEDQCMSWNSNRRNENDSTKGSQTYVLAWVENNIVKGEMPISTQKFSETAPEGSL